jgi:hypothetical protein
MIQVRRNHGVSTADACDRPTTRDCALRCSRPGTQRPFQIPRVPEQQVVKEFSPNRVMSQLRIDSIAEILAGVRDISSRS